MSTLFVTRHPGARDWLARRGHVVDRISDELTDADLAALAPGDTVIGTLPVALAAAVCARGARYLNLVIPAVPRELRGQELDADTLTRLGARIEAFEVWPGAVTAGGAAQVQVCIVSDQLLPNLILALQAPRPQRVYALSSTRMRAGAERLRDLLEAEGVGCEIVADLPEGIGDFDRWARVLAQTLRRVHPGVGVVLNATGGTKLMSLALVDAFRRWLPDAEIVYTDTARGRQVSVTQRSESPLASVLDLPLHLGAGGAYLIDAASGDAGWQARVEARAGLSRWYVQHAGRLGAFFTQINAMASAALDDQTPPQLVAPGQCFRQPLRPPVLRAAEMARDAGLIELDGDGQTLRFTCAEAAGFLRGGWLEEFAWLCARDAGIEHIGCNVHVEWETGARAAPDNELDLVLVHGNRMLVAECKTGRFGRDTDAGVEQAVLNKLDALSRHVAGSLGHTLLLSAWRLSDAARTRAGNYRITVLDGDGLGRLGAVLAAWRDQAG